MQKSLHDLMLNALAAAAVADNGADAATAGHKTVTTSMFDVAKEARTEERFNQAVSELYQFLSTAAGATWAQGHNVLLVASKRKDYPYKLPQSFLNAVSTLRGALKRDCLKGSYAATKKAKAEATKAETDAKRMRRVQDETLSIEQRHLAAEGLASRRRDIAIAAINAAFKDANVKGKEHIATALEAVVKALPKAKAPKAVTLPNSDNNHAARPNAANG